MCNGHTTGAASQMMNKHCKQRDPESSSHGYPRPLLQRRQWISLDGPWEFGIDAAGSIERTAEVRFDRQITVPFAPETPASGVGENGLFNACWYRRTFQRPAMEKDQRLILRFEAVDYRATVWINDKLAVRHEGGYTPFWADITDLLVPEAKQVIVVRAQDNPLDLSQPRGKQDWKPEPHSIWYPRTSGIWQSVWLECVNASHIARLRWQADASRWEINLHARITSPLPADHGLRLRVRLKSRGQSLADDIYAITDHLVERTIVLPDPGINDAREELMWSPWKPNLIDAELELIDERDNILDAVTSYTAMRSINISRDRLVLNGKPIVLQMLLDQGYWPQSGLTAPDDDAFRRDIELIKSMGFNGVRKHQKIESSRFLYWADRLGLFVWEEMPSVYNFSSQSMRRLTRQWMEAIERDASHPCIIAWVPFNESWGVPDLPTSDAQRHAVQAMYHLTKMFDPTRPVIGNDGWEAAATDVVGVHDYESDPQKLLERYDTRDKQLDRILNQERPGHRILTLEGFTYSGQPIILSEFGGIAYSKDRNHTWGYSRARSSQDLAKRYAALLHAVRSTPVFAGFCYTQFTDTYQEANGLLYMDRTPKFPIEEIAVATRGVQSRQEQRIADRLIASEPTKNRS